MRSDYSSMTRTIAFLFLLIHLGAFGQQDVQRIVNLPRKQLEKLTPQTADNTVIVPADFAKPDVSRQPRVPTGTIEKVYYFYTSYHQNPGFNQKALDAKRISGLAALFPEVLSDRFIQWELIEQTGCTAAADGDSFFHGFALVYRTEPTTKDRNEEIARMQQFLEHPEQGFVEPDYDAIADEVNHESGDTPTPSEDKDAQFPDGNFALFQYFRDSIPGGGKMALNHDDMWVPYSFQVDEKGKISDLRFGEAKPYIQETIQQLMDRMPAWEPAVKNGEPVASRVNLDLRMSFSPIVRGMYKRDGEKPSFKQEEVNDLLNATNATDEETEERIDRTEKGSVFRGMELVVPREKVAVVMDVTTSMSQHIAGFSWWLMNSPDSLNIVHYAFFNDGDNMEDRHKKIGETGGIYQGKKQFDLTATLMDAMSNGNGGDLTENDLEAALRAQEQAPEASALLLIVDNFSDVRDMKLLSSITKKTHVLVAGNVTAVRECYLDIAKATGGDVIVNGERISLENVKAGGQIRIAESNYRFDGRSFSIL